MTTEAAPPEIERRITAWHEAGHVVATLISRHFDIGDPAVDFRSSPRAKAVAGVKKLSGPGPAIVAEAKELYAIAIGGLVAEWTLESVSKTEGRAIYPSEDGASADIAWAHGLIAHHRFDEEQLEEEARALLEEHLLAIIELGDWLWRLDADVVSRDEVLAQPAAAALYANHPKATVAPAPIAGELAAGGFATKG